MVVEILQLEVGVHGCRNTNRNENYYLLSTRGVDSFDEGKRVEIDVARWMKRRTSRIRTAGTYT